MEKSHGIIGKNGSADSPFQEVFTAKQNIKPGVNSMKRKQNRTQS